MIRQIIRHNGFKNIKCLGLLIQSAFISAVWNCSSIVCRIAHGKMKFDSGKKKKSSYESFDSERNTDNKAAPCPSLWNLTIGKTRCYIQTFYFPPSVWFIWMQMCVLWSTFFSFRGGKQWLWKMNMSACEKSNTLVLNPPQSDSPAYLLRGNFWKVSLSTAGWNRSSGGCGAHWAITNTGIVSSVSSYKSEVLATGGP